MSMLRLRRWSGWPVLLVFLAAGLAYLGTLQAGRKQQEEGERYENVNTLN